MAEMEEKMVEVKNRKYKLENGDQVTLFMKRSLGMKAVFLGYILPFLIVLISLIIFSLIIDNEGVAGLLSLAIVVPYYLILYRFRDDLKKTFEFSIQKTN